MKELGEQWIEVIEGERHLVMEVKSDKEHAACPRCMFNGRHGTCVYPEDDCPVRNGHYIKDLGILNEDGCLPCPFCGEYPKIIHPTENMPVVSIVHTGAGHRILLEFFSSEQEAIDEWNRRAR